MVGLFAFWEGFRAYTDLGGGSSAVWGMGGLRKGRVRPRKGSKGSESMCVCGWVGPWWHLSGSAFWDGRAMPASRDTYRIAIGQNYNLPAMPRPNPQHVPHHDPNIAYHQEWEFRREAIVWDGGYPARINLHPVATEFRQWLLQMGQFSVLGDEHRNQPAAFTNPYTYHASVLAAILANVIIASHAVSRSSTETGAMEVEIERIRLYGEQVLYTARVCEALIKQLLYCTQIPRRYYDRAALGTLLSTECRGCKNSDGIAHKVSLLGSLAHRYGLCTVFEGCVFEHLKVVNRLRASEAAHAEAQMMCIRTAEESRKQLDEDSTTTGNELVHMLEHISDLEGRMIAELRARFFPPPSNFFAPK